jgi:hypothetical protein
MDCSPEAAFWDEFQTKVLRVFFLAIQSHLYSFAYCLKLAQPLTVYTVHYSIHCKGERKKT